MDWNQIAGDFEALAQGLSDDLARFDSEANQSAPQPRLLITGDDSNNFRAALESAVHEALELLYQFSHNRCDSEDLVDFAARNLHELTHAEQKIVWVDPASRHRYMAFVRALGELPRVIPKGKLGRRDFYVYVHRDSKGQIFYVGKGSGRRAWSIERDALWQQYVETRSGGKHTVEIVRDGLLEREALELEDELTLEHGEFLVNWSRPLPSLEVTLSDGQITARTVCDKGRNTDSAALERRNQMHDANLRFVQETKAIEESDPEQAVSNYRKAFERMREYESIEYEHGLVADLHAEVYEKVGDPVILDRLTLCLKKLKRTSEMLTEAERFFSEFPGAKSTSLGRNVLKRVEWAKRTMQS